MENEISVLVGLAVVAGVFYFYNKKDKKSVSKTSYSTPVSEKNQPKRGPGSTPKRTAQERRRPKADAKKKAPAKAKKPAVAKKTAPKKTTAKKAGPKKGSAKPNLKLK
tara:strand:+ start:1290 stop:1613 length:324 start_codon:yes stop_codon:yes gene_type:complete